MVEPGASLSGELDGLLLKLLSRGEANPEDLQAVAVEYRAMHQDPREISRVNPDTTIQTVFAVLGTMSDWLGDHNDRAPGTEWGPVFDKLAEPFIKRDGQTPWWEAFERSAQQLSDWIYVGLIERDLSMVADLARWWTVHRLMELPDRDEITAADTARHLAAYVPQLAVGLRQLVPRARVELVREASVADLFVVRSEWRSYLLGDIAAVTNVLPGEMHQHLSKSTSEQEDTSTSETSTQTQTETSSEEETQSELSSETASQLHAEINGFVRADVEANWGMVAVKASGGFEGRLSLDQMQRQASRIARRSVERAVSKVDNLTRQSRARRTLSRTEDTVDSKLDNTGGDLVRGVYRWLDRVDRYQLFRYPDRLQLEFQLPEPAEYLRWLADQRARNEGEDGPPRWTLTSADIIPDEAALLALAAKYRATNLPALPAAEVSVVQSLKAEAKGEHGTPPKSEDTVPVPVAAEELELLVPPGYEATGLSFSGIATPAWGTWLSENADGRNWGRNTGWHGAVVSVLVGDHYYWSSNQVSGSPEHPSDAVPRVLGLDAKLQWPRFGNAFVEINGGNQTVPLTVTFTPPATGKVKVAVQGAGVTAAHLAVTLTCRRTDEAEFSWRQAVYDTLFDAWSAWQRTWDADRSRAAELAMLTSGGSSARVNQIIRDEIKRQVIAWLLGPAPFAGMPGLRPADTTDPSWRDIDYDAARATAPTIEFLEQAFEWGNLNFMLYPYYWAGRERWDELQQIQHPNPDLERFLKAGSARVVVPARPALAGAVQNWLIYQEPFFGRPLPVPGDPLFVSVAQEIRDLTEPPTDGEPSDSWEARIGTTLLWLDDTGQLPRNASGTLGAAPHEPDPLLSGPTP